MADGVGLGVLVVVVVPVEVDVALGELVAVGVSGGVPVSVGMNVVADAVAEGGCVSVAVEVGGVAV